MRKFSMYLIVVMALGISSCKMDTISKIDSGINVIDKCYKTFSGEGQKAGCIFIHIEERKAATVNDAVTLLPTYTWDAKQMMW